MFITFSVGLKHNPMTQLEVPKSDLKENDVHPIGKT
jgi:hypothetical protein